MLLSLDLLLEKNYSLSECNYVIFEKDATIVLMHPNLVTPNKKYKIERRHNHDETIHYLVNDRGEAEYLESHIFISYSRGLKIFVITNEDFKELKI